MRSISDRLLQINPNKEYRPFDTLRAAPRDSHEIVLNDGRVSGRRFLKGRRVYLKDAGGRGLVGRGTVLEERQPRAMPPWQQQFLLLPYDPDQERALIQVDKLVEPPLSRTRLQKYPVFSEATLFKDDKDTQGAVFRVATPTADVLDRLIGF